MQELEPVRGRVQALGRVPELERGQALVPVRVLVPVLGQDSAQGQGQELEQGPEQVLVQARGLARVLERLLLWLWWSVQSSPQYRALSLAQ